MTEILIRRGKFGHSYRKFGNIHVIIEVDIEVIHPQGKECQGWQPPKVRKRQGKILF